MRTIGFLLFVLVWLAGFAAAALYLFTPSILPYHAEAMGATEATLPPRVVSFYFAAVRSIGILNFAMAFVGAYLLFGRIRVGDGLAALVFVAAYAGTGIGATVVAYKLHEATGANTPWQLPLVALAGLLIGYFMWLPPRTSDESPKP